MRRNSLPRKKRDVRDSRGVRQGLEEDGASEDVAVEGVEVHGSVEEVDCLFLAASCYNSLVSACHDSTFASRATNTTSRFGSDTRLDVPFVSTTLYQQLIPADSLSQGAHGDYARGVIVLLLEEYACEQTKDEIRCPTTRDIGPLIVFFHFVEKTLPREADQARYIDEGPRTLDH